MRKLLTLLIILTGFSASAQLVAGQDHRFRIYTNGLFALPVGAFGNSTDHIITGPAKHGWGASLGIGKYFGPDIYLGIALGEMSVKLDAGAATQHMRDVFSMPGAYNTAVLDGDKYAVKYIGIECAKNFRLKKIELEPYVILAIGGVDGLPNAHFRNKLKNDNYYQQIDFTYLNDANEFDFFYPTLGVRAQKEMLSWLYLNAGFAFATGAYEAKLQTTTSDLEGNQKVSNSNYTQHISNLQFSLGLQFRFGRK